MKVRIRIKTDVSILFIESQVIGSATSSENLYRYSKLHRLHSCRFIALLTLDEAVTHIHAAPATSAEY
jgi:hypothetical protein